MADTNFDSAEKIVEKVRALLALSTSPNEHEAAAALNKAQELLLKYKMSMSDMQRLDSHVTAQSVEDIVFPYDVDQQWRSTLLGIIARANFCSVVNERANGNTVLFGYRGEMEVTKALYEWVLEQLLRLSQRYFLVMEIEHLDVNHKELRISQKKRKIWFDSFFTGAVESLNSRLKRHEHSPDANVQALVVSNMAALTEYASQRWVNLRSSRALTIKDGSARSLGRQAGNTVQLSGRPERLAGGQHLIGGR